MQTSFDGCQPPGADPTDLLVRLDRALADVAEVRALDDARFLETHVLYEESSDQQRRILRWFEAEVASQVGAGQPYRVLSVGCGSGILDVPLARALTAHGAGLRYVGVDPNRVECEAFLERFAAARVDADVAAVAATFEDLETSERFDLVHIVHCLYYLPDAGAALARARALLAPGGRLVVFHAPRGALNALAARFYDKLYGRPTLFAEEVAALCEAARWPVRRERLDARLDATAYLGGLDQPAADPAVALMLRDFLVQVDSDRLPTSVQRLVDEYLEAVAVRDDAARTYLPHPVDVFDFSDAGSGPGAGAAGPGAGAAGPRG